MAVEPEALEPAQPVPAGPLYRKLSPGPGLSPGEVASDQRARISSAMIEAVARHGYSGVTIRELVRLAGVSTHTFYEHFGCKEECLLATCELAMRRAARLVSSQRGGGALRERLLSAFGALAEEAVRRPCAVRLALLEAPPALVPAGLVRLRRVNWLFEAVAGEGLAGAAGDAVASPLLVKGIVAGLAHVARARLLDGREGELPGLAEEMAEWALCLCDEAAGGLGGIGPASARHAFDPEAGSGFGLAGEEPLGDERALILAAVMRLAVDDGYRELTVPRIRARAGVSRRSFDAHFEDVADCFLAARELRARRALADAARVGAGRGWQDGVHRALAALCAGIARQPALAGLVLTEVVAPGQAGMRCRTRLIAAAADRLRASIPAAERPGELAAEASVGAIWGILEHHVATGRVRALPHAIPTLSLLAIAPAIGAPAAVEAIRDAQQPREGARYAVAAAR